MVDGAKHSFTHSIIQLLVYLIYSCIKELFMGWCTYSVPGTRSVQQVQSVRELWSELWAVTELTS